jgi:hypothetical protein
MSLTRLRGEPHAIAGRIAPGDTGQGAGTDLDHAQGDVIGQATPGRGAILRHLSIGPSRFQTASESPNRSVLIVMKLPQPSQELHSIDHEGGPMVTFDSCHSRWVFDTERLRFRRVLRGSDRVLGEVVTEWRPYEELQIDEASGCFVVVLDQESRRMLRSWIHRGHVCQHCETSSDQGASEEGQSSAISA